MKTVSDGLVVLFEGVDGAGKTTQLELAHQELFKQGWSVYTARNLGGTPIGEALREALLARMSRPPLTDLYVSVGIQEALLEAIHEERKVGSIVLLDRSPLSLAAYGIFANGVSESVGWPHVDAGMKALRAELTLFLETDNLETAVQRARQSSGTADYFESKPIAYFKKVQQGYETAVKRYPVQHIDADRSIQTIHKDIMKQIQKALKAKL
jgi:dTMP kinase